LREPAAARCSPSDARLQNRRRLAGCPSEDITKNQDGALTRRQHLHRRQERELNRFSRDDHRIGLIGAGSDLVEQPVRIRLQPRHFGERPHRGQASRVAPDHVEADIGGDAIQPRPRRRPRRDVTGAAPCAQQRLLHGVLGFIKRRQHPVAVHVQLAPVALAQRRKC
jgi:hypothetical protein